MRARLRRRRTPLRLRHSGSSGLNLPRAMPMMAISIASTGTSWRRRTKARAAATARGSHGDQWVAVRRRLGGRGGKADLVRLLVGGDLGRTPGHLGVLGLHPGQHRSREGVPCRRLLEQVGLGPVAEVGGFDGDGGHLGGGPEVVLEHDLAAVDADRPKTVGQ